MILGVFIWKLKRNESISTFQCFIHRPSRVAGRQRHLQSVVGWKTSAQDALFWGMIIDEACCFRKVEVQ